MGLGMATPSARSASAPSRSAAHPPGRRGRPGALGWLRRGLSVTGALLITVVGCLLAADA